MVWTIFIIGALIALLSASKTAKGVAGVIAMFGLTALGVFAMFGAVYLRSSGL